MAWLSRALYEPIVGFSELNDTHTGWDTELATLSSTDKPMVKILDPFN